MQEHRIHFKTHSPVDGRQLSEIRPASVTEVDEAVRKAAEAQSVWKKQSLNERIKAMKAACRRMLEQRKEILDILLWESGKYPVEGLFSEAIAPLDQLTHWVRVIRPYLKSSALPISALSFPGKKGYVEIIPRGVIGVIAPWNYPMANLFKPVFPALLCGNGVVIKPSEHAPRAAEWFVKQMAAYLPEGIIQCVHGGAETGQALIRAGIQGLVFTGSPKSGRAVLTAAAERLIPCSAELGGKDPAIVLDDCRADRTAAGIVNWALHNNGQNCGAIERVYVLNAIADEFVRQLCESVSQLRYVPPEDPSIDIGPMNNRQQLELVEQHVQDALQKGATLLCGGQRFGNGLGYAPTVLDHCDHSMKIMTEETFGPVIPVMRVRDEEEAIRMVNDSVYGLNASVWTENIRRGKRIASRLIAGTVNINNHAITGAMPFAPWGGVKESGYGIANSIHSLSVFVRPKTWLIDQNTLPDPWWYPFDASLIEIGHRLAEVQLGRLVKALALPFHLRRRQKTIQKYFQFNKRQTP